MNRTLWVKGGRKCLYFGILCISTFKERKKKYFQLYSLLKADCAFTVFGACIKKPYFYAICGSFNESVYYLMCKCEEINDWRIQGFGKEDLDFDWLVRVFTDEFFVIVRKLVRFFRLAMNLRARFVEDYVSFFFLRISCQFTMTYDR